MEAVLKAIETGDFAGGQGLLTREQQTQYIVLMKRYASLLAAARTVVMPQAAMDISKLHSGEPITISVSENSNPQQNNKLLSNQVHLDARKTKSQYDLTTEVLQQNIEGEEFEMTAMRAMAGRSATDLEYLALLGDTTLTPAPNDKLGNLLVGNDGWYKLARDGGHVLDLGGAQLEPGVFSEMLRMMPAQYQGDPNLRFIVGHTTVIDWQDVLQGRQTGLGDAALGSAGANIAPYGRPLQMVPLIPNNLPLTVSEATPAEVGGSAFGAFQIESGVNDQLVVAINGGAPLTVTFTAGVRETREIVATINAAFVAAGLLAVAFDDTYGRLRIKTTNTGAATSVAITIPATRDASYTFGLTDGVTPVTVTGAAVTGTVYEGTFVMLTNPMNLIWGILAGTRMFTEFNKDFDRIETIAYNQTDAQVENLDACVLGINLRGKRHVATATP
jgi:hypothetical protein